MCTGLAVTTAFAGISDIAGSHQHGSYWRKADVTMAGVLVR
jgi:hypothetical protein